MLYGATNDDDCIAFKSSVLILEQFLSNHNHLVTLRPFKHHNRLYTMELSSLPSSHTYSYTHTLQTNPEGVVERMEKGDKVCGVGLMVTGCFNSSA